ncbi:MAG: peptidoglycan bridge formation glycyltransferase FemA/FemB family protein [bacterium]
MNGSPLSRSGMTPFSYQVENANIKPMKSILQTKEWADFKSKFDFEIIEFDNHFIHKRSLPFNQNFLYLPEVAAKDFSASSIEELKKVTSEQSSIFARLELIDEFSDNAHKLLRTLGFQKAFEELQPKWRHVIDLTPTRGEILAQMKQKGRYNIKLSERKGVKIDQYALSEIDKKRLKFFYTLYLETVKREGITGRSYEYFEKLVDSFKETDYFSFYIASFKNEPLSGALVSFYDKNSLYLYGGSSRQHSEVMAPYLMHWQIMADAKERGMTSYDMLGRSPVELPTSGTVGIPTGSSGRSVGGSVGKNHKWAGVTRFKEQFGGRAVEILGSYDYINKPVWYKLFRIAEKMRRK